MRASFRKILIVSCTFIGGLYFFLEFIIPGFLLPETVFGVPFTTFDTKISQSTILVSAMAVGLGIINLLRVHGSKIVRARSGWINSVALLSGLFVVFGIEFVDFMNAETRLDSLDRFRAVNFYISREQNSLDQNKLSLVKASLQSIQADISKDENILNNDTDNSLNDSLESIISSIPESQESISTLDTAALITAIESAEKIARNQSEENYQNSTAKLASSFVFVGLFTPLGSAMFSLLAFYVATAAYRAFRIRSLEAGIMMITAVIVMLGQIPHGPLYISEHLPDIRNWLLLNISTPAFRAIFFGSAIAGLAMAIRMWFSLEQSPLSSEGESK